MEPVDHGIGRSRGGLTSKIHLAVDGNGRPLSVLITPGNINDTIMMTTVLGQIRVRRAGAGRPRTRPERVLADRGYPSRANRVWLARRGIKVTIPDRADQHTHRPPRSPRRAATGLRPHHLPPPQRRRTRDQPAQELARHRHAQRQDRPQLPHRDLPGRHPHLATKRLDQHALARASGAMSRLPRGGRSAVFGMDCNSDWRADR